MNKTYTTTLSGKELEIIEKLIAEYGNVVDFDMIYGKFGKNRKKQEIKNFISNLVKKGWLIRVKRGTFIISDISGRGSVELSQATIAQIINNNSYVSFEAALQHHGLFDQYLSVITSIGMKRAYVKKFFNWTFKYIKTKKGLFRDYEEYNIDGQLIKIALKEKTIIDFLLYRRTAHDFDFVIEKLKNYKNEFNEQKFLDISQDCSITTRRILGVILDLVNIDSSELYKTIKDNKNYSFMNGESDLFNAKWRIYTDKKIINK
jgi:predicted transcriptional regulator of viral defense system